MEAEIIRQFGNHCRINKFGRDAELFCIILLSIVIPAEAGIQNTSNAWYLRIIPRFMERAGFELSTGIMVNSVEAKRASEELRNI